LTLPDRLTTALADRYRIDDRKVAIKVLK